MRVSELTAQLSESEFFRIPVWQMDYVAMNWPRKSHQCRKMNFGEEDGAARRPKALRTLVLQWEITPTNLLSSPVLPFQSPENKHNGILTDTLLTDNFSIFWQQVFLPIWTNGFKCEILKAVHTAQPVGSANLFNLASSSLVVSKLRIQHAQPVRCSFLNELSSRKARLKPLLQRCEDH